MTVEPDVVRRKLLEIGDATGHLRSWLPVTIDQLETDQQLRWAVERGLQLAAEALFDVGAHLLAAEFQEVVDEYRQIPRRLLARGVLSSATADRLKGLAGFRNILVHEYADIDLQRVHAVLARLGDFDAFVAEVEHWLQTHAGVDG
jgi:uncharacterized protein YutE (UPF0331/DUF86 family)